MRKITALMPSSATESPCRRKAAATTAWRCAASNTAIPPSPTFRQCRLVFLHLWFHVIFMLDDYPTMAETSQGHLVIVCLIFNRVQAAGAVDLGALQSTWKTEKTIRKYFVSHIWEWFKNTFENDIENDWRTARTLSCTPNDHRSSRVPGRDRGCSTASQTPQICIFPPNFYHISFICFHFYVGTWRISEGFVWSHATLARNVALAQGFLFAHSKSSQDLDLAPCDAKMKTKKKQDKYEVQKV